jgi:uncharacterized protein YkwD
MRSKSAVAGIFSATAIFVLAFGAAAQNSKTKPKPKSAPTAKTKSAAASAGKSLSPLSGLSAEVMSEIQSLRADPASYIKYLEDMKGEFKGTLLNLKDGGQLMTTEGVAGVDDAVAFLKAARSAGSYKISPGLTSAADDQLADMIKNDLNGHKGSDGSWPPTRVERYGHWGGEVKENISYHARSARDIVLNMLIDDGNPKRDHRKNLLSPGLRYIGISSGNSNKFGELCVVVFTAEFFEKGGSGKTRSF